MDDWLWEMENNIIGVVVLDFSVAFDIIDHKVLLKNIESYGFVESAFQLSVWQMTISLL